MPSKSITLSSGVSYAPYGTLTVTETGTSAASNSSTVSAVLVLHRPYEVVSSATKSASMTINGTTYSWSGTIGGQGDLTLISKTLTITHDSDGKKTINISASITLEITWSGTYIKSVSNSGSLALTALELYPTVSQTMTSKTETSITMAWESDKTIDRVWYSTNGGSSWSSPMSANAKKGSYTITGLTPGQTYSVVTSLRAKDSQLYKNSAATSIRTYWYPYANAMPNFTIGDSFTIGVYNPLGRTYSIAVIGADGSVLTASSTYSGTSVPGWNSAAAVDFWYKSIPTSKSGTYKVRVTYSGHADTETGGTYTVKASECAPIIGSVSYADTNTDAVHVTGDDQQIVQNLSTVQYTATGLQAQKYADGIFSVSVTVNNNTKVLLYDPQAGSATENGGTINSSTNVEAVFTVTDSRGISATKSVTIQMLAWGPPSGAVTLARHSNYYSETDIKVDASVSYLNGTNTATITYRYKQTSSQTWGAWATLQNNTTATFTANNESEWNVQVQIVDALGATTTINKTLGRGIPIMYFDTLRNSVSFNGFPENDNSMEIGWNFLRLAPPTGAPELILDRKDNGAKADIYVEAGTDPTLAMGLYDSTNTWHPVTKMFKEGFYPYTRNGANLGGTGLQWQNIAGETIYEDGTKLADKYAPTVTSQDTVNIGWTDGNTVPTATWTTLGSYTFDPGKYFVLTRVEFSGYAAGYREIMWTASDNVAYTFNQQTYETAAGHSTWTNLQSVFFTNITTQTTRYLRCNQNSGQALRTYVYVQIVKLG